MLLKTRNMKYTNKFIGIFATALLFATTTFAQKRVDGVVAVVGDYVVLDSDIDKTYLEIKSRGVNADAIKRCELLGMLMEDKFYAHHAVQDSVPVSEEEIRAIMENNIEYLVKNIGSMAKVLEYYRKKSED